MPDDPASKPVEQQPVEHGKQVDAPHTSLSPNTPNTQQTKSVSDQTVQSQIGDIRDRIKRGELWMIILTAVIAFFALCSIVVGILQWNAMKGQLKEMHDGGVDTHSLAVSAGTQATATQTLADRMKDQAGSTKQMAGDNHNLLEGTQAAFMTFRVRTEIPSHTVQFDGGNNGNAEARDVHAYEVITIRNWPSKSIRLGPFNRPLGSKRVGKEGGMVGMGGTGYFHDDYVIPNITPEIADDLADGKAYIAVQWQANYQDGFGTRVYWPIKEVCQASIEVGKVKCQTAPNSFMDNTYIGDGPCASIDSLRRSREQDMSDAQKTCKTK
ncbi:MAG TPA: hypothetical protein VK574_20700 [Terracidiphilus sp.]|nr:hypothetical protein [Terracidiphilus sp.]